MCSLLRFRYRGVLETDKIYGWADQFDMHESAVHHKVQLRTAMHVTGLRARRGAPVGLGDGCDQHGCDAGDSAAWEGHLDHGDAVYRRAVRQKTYLPPSGGVYDMAIGGSWRGTTLPGPVSLIYAALAAGSRLAAAVYAGTATNGNSLYTPMIQKFSRIAPLLSVLALAACDSQQPPKAVAPVSQVQPPTAAETAVAEPQAPSAAESTSGKEAGVKEIDWDALIPDDYSPEKLLSEYQADSLEDDDPRAAELMEKLQKLWDEAPVRSELDGQTVKLPGFTVPLEGDSQETRSFLLVPYYGACIHVPPPPANQTVYVLREAGKGTRLGEFDVVWVTGTMSVKRTENEMAEAGYTLYATEVAPYEE